MPPVVASQHIPSAWAYPFYLYWQAIIFEEVLYSGGQVKAAVIVGRETLVSNLSIYKLMPTGYENGDVRNLWNR